MYKHLFFAVSAAILLVGSISETHAQQLNGRFNDGASTSIRILSEKPLRVRYCYRGRCSNWNGSGTVASFTLKFPRNGSFPGATFSATKTGNGYNATYQQNGGQKFTATYR